MRWNLFPYGSIATDQMQVGDLAENRTDAGRINRFGNQTDARPLGEMRFYAFSQYERENDFGSHCLPTPSYPQPLPKFLLLSIMFS